MSSPSKPFTFISTFAGCGGSSVGYKMAGGIDLAAVEYDRHACETYRLNFPGVPVLERDIATVTAQDLLDLTGLQIGNLDILDGSPPCQGFSTAGKRVVHDPRNSLFKEFVRLLDGLQPKVFVMENVSGMVKGQMKWVFAQVMQALKGAGYDVSCRLLNAMYFGVPQNRQRVIFIGVRKDLGIRPSHPKPQRRPIALKAICPDVLASRSMKINPWIPASQPCCTISKTPYKGLFQTRIGEREPTETELSELASFPEDFIFPQNKRLRWAHIGNSVPPLLMKAIAEHIRDHILAMC